jgi:effector-binding domain-containing protein
MPDYSIVRREPVPYAAIRASAPMSELAAVMVPLGEEIFGWLGRRGLSPAGPLFWRYAVIDMAHELVIDVGVPLGADAAGDDRVTTGVLPAGRYVTVVHRGHPDTLITATAGLLAWGDQQGVSWDKTDVDGAEHWVCRLENYLSDPRDEPDPSTWRTELAFKVR